MNNLVAQFNAILSNEILRKQVANEIQVGLLYAMLGVILFVIISQLLDDQKHNRIFKKTTKHSRSKLTDVFFVNKIRDNMELIGREHHKKPDYAKKSTSIITVGVLLFGLFMTSQGQLAIGVASPWILMLTISKLTNMLITSQNEYVIRDLPQVVDAIKRYFTKYDDLKTVLYYASEYIPEPMKSELQGLSKRMNSEIPEDVLDEYMRRQKNLWLYSFTFSLLNYVQDANKREVIGQLDKLKSILLEEGRSKKKEQFERKLTIAINYTLCVVAIVGAIANIMFNTSARFLFFSTPYGAAAFIIGIVLIVVSVFSNILLGSGKGG